MVTNFVHQTLGYPLSSLNAFATTVLVLLCAFCLYYRAYKCAPLSLYYAPSELNTYLARTVAAFHKVYCPTPYLANGILQTVWYLVLRRGMQQENWGIQYDRQLVPLADGSQVSLDWPRVKVEGGDNEKTPIVVILPGMCGDLNQNYVAHLVFTAPKAGFRPVIFNQRGLSGTPIKVRLPCNP